MNDCLRAALGYLGRGWAALAVCPPDHRDLPPFHRATCSKPGKRPIGPWKAWQTRLPTLDELTAQWELVPAANVGIVLGPASGLVGVDVDGEEGEHILEEASGGDLPGTLTFVTGRGRRLLYAVDRDGDVPTRTFSGSGGEVKILAAGTLTVMPPSRHISGRKYRWLRRRGPGDIRAAWAPEWLGRHQQGKGARDQAGVVGAPIPEGQRNTRLFKIACALRRHGCTPHEILQALRIVNLRCEPPLHPEELEGIARSAGRYLPVTPTPRSRSAISTVSLP
jgi:hypothetical protein